MCMQMLTSLLSLIMTEVQSKHRAFLPIVFTSICSKKPLLTSILNLSGFIVNTKGVKTERAVP